MAFDRAWVRELLRPGRLSADKRRRPGDTDDAGCPVEPNRPLNLSGGAAAALEFDE